MLPSQRSSILTYLKINVLFHPIAAQPLSCADPSADRPLPLFDPNAARLLSFFSPHFNPNEIRLKQMPSIPPYPG